MTDELAFVGDIHGNILALETMYARLIEKHVDEMVFLGDYINKGPESARVVELLVELESTTRVTVLLGNHEELLLRALDTGDLAPFLKAGGAQTIRSYLGHPVGPDVLTEFRGAIPNHHLRFLRRMKRTYATSEVVAEHVLPPAPDARYRIGAHTPVGVTPVVTPSFAQLDTGCGVGEGRLTSLLWPSRDIVQVNNDGQAQPMQRISA